MFFYTLNVKVEKNITERSDTVAKAERDFSIFTCLAGLSFFLHLMPLRWLLLVLHLVGLVVFAVVSSR